MLNIKLPKQWKHWCKKAGLRPHGGGRRWYDWCYLKGHGRVWRINCHNKLQCGDTYEEFDRWALCDIEEGIFPTSESQLVFMVQELLLRKHTKQGEKHA